MYGVVSGNANYIHRFSDFRWEALSDQASYLSIDVRAFSVQVYAELFYTEPKQCCRSARGDRRDLARFFIVP